MKGGKQNHLKALLFYLLVFFNQDKQIGLNLKNLFYNKPVTKPYFYCALREMGEKPTPLGEDFGLTNTR